MNRILIYIGGALLAAFGIATYVERKRIAPIGQAIVNKMRSLSGTLYKWGGKDPSSGGLDCSGAVTWVLQSLGLVPKGYTKNTDQLYSESQRVLVPQPGDLVFYGSIFDISHVMVYAGDGLVVGATGGGPSTNTAAEARAKGAMVKTVPVNYRSDLVAYGRLPFRAV